MAKLYISLSLVMLKRRKKGCGVDVNLIYCMAFGYQRAPSVVTSDIHIYIFMTNENTHLSRHLIKVIITLFTTPALV